jgi:hypothetical protein
MNELTIWYTFSNVLMFEIDPQTLKKVIDPNFMPKDCRMTSHIFGTFAQI